MYKATPEEMKNLVDSLLVSYQKHPVICNIDCTNRLNRNMTIEILEMIRFVLFPGYFELKNLKGSSI